MKKNPKIILFLLLVLVLLGCTPTKNETLHKEFYSKVAGVTFENADGVNRQELVPLLKANEELKVVREPNNPHDLNAVALYGSLGQVGYVNADLAPYISSYLDKGNTVRVWASEVTGGNGLYFGCNILIRLYVSEN